VVMSAQQYQARQTEAQFQQAVIDLARTLGWVPVHFRQMVGNPSGYPDLTIIRGERVILAELKRENGKVSQRQQEWIERMAAVGTTIHVWRPSDWSTICEALQ
jgi:hypothetical protein